MTLIKTLGQGQTNTVTVGDLVTYTITIANQGNVNSNTYDVRDRYPLGMSFVSASDGGTDNAANRSIRWDGLSNLDPGQTKELSLILRVDDATQGDFRNWAEITDDSSEDFNTTDDDSTPDFDRGDDDAPGFGTGPNDDVNNHNDITLDNPQLVKLLR